MNSGLFRSFAKLNLHLQVERRMDDGYHELTTVFQTVGVHDLVGLEVLPAPGIEVVVPDGGAPADQSNLAWRAAAAVLERWAPSAGVRIELIKRIPSGGGLGGGSSNAATVLLGLSELLEVSPAGSELTDVARGLGADVPYFLVGGTALGTGRGDDILALAELAEEMVWLVDPGVAVSTAEVFEALAVPPARPRPSAIAGLENGLVPSSIAALGGFNDLEATVFERVPEVRNVYNALRRAGASCVRLSGSGGTVFACFGEFERGDEVRSHLPEGARALATRTLSRSAMTKLRTVRAGERESI